MIELNPHADGWILPVRASPGARVCAIRGQHDGSLKVSVTQAREKGKAIQAIVMELCRELDLRKNQIELLRGETSTTKKFLVRDIDRTTLTERIERSLST